MFKCLFKYLIKIYLTRSWIIWAFTKIQIHNRKKKLMIIEILIGNSLLRESKFPLLESNSYNETSYWRYSLFSNLVYVSSITITILSDFKSNKIFPFNYYGLEKTFYLCCNPKEKRNMERNLCILLLVSARILTNLSLVCIYPE